MMAWCCPCFLFGKTQARLEDPTLANYSPINDNVRLPSPIQASITNHVCLL